MRFERITLEPDKMGGVPCIRGLRIPVATVVGMVAEGMTTDEILEAYPRPRARRRSPGARVCRRGRAGAGASSQAWRLRFLLDESLSPLVKPTLTAGGHDAVHVRDFGLTSASDPTVLPAALEDGRVL